MLKSLFRVRDFALAIVALLIVSPLSVLCAQVISAPAAQASAAVQQAGGAVAATAGAVEQTAWGLPMPKLTMPKLTMPKLTMPPMALPSMGAVTGPFKQSFGKVTAGSKKAWEGTKEIFSFGQNKTATQNRAGGQQQPSFWQRLLVRESPVRVPETVGEFMAQPRLDP